MAHQTLRGNYQALSNRLNRFPQGAPPTRLLFEILQILFSEKEADLVARLPVRPFSLKRAARVWKMPLQEAHNILDKLAARGLLVDFAENGTNYYVLPPPMAGFFEFSLMRLRADIDQKVLSELFFQYLTEEEEFMRDLVCRGETQMGRVFVNEPALTDDNALQVLDFERASHVIRTASCIGLGICYCRHKTQHLGKACQAPTDICMTFNTVAESLTKHGIARKIDAQECLTLLDQAYEHNLVQFGENVRKRVSFICNCCGCCCEALVAARRFAIMQPVHTTNFEPVIQTQSCKGCGRCVSVCPVEALTLVSANDPHKIRRKQAKLDNDRCLGCAVCARVCKTQSISLRKRPSRIQTPLNAVHRTIVMAIERGNLQDLIFDNQVLLSHRALAAVLATIVKLPPIKQALANKQLKSRYLETLCEPQGMTKIFSVFDRMFG